MAATSEEMEAGYKKIHRWCQFEFRQFTKDIQLEVSQVMQEAIQRLRARPNLLKSICFPTWLFLAALTPAQRRLTNADLFSSIVNPQRLPRRSHSRRTQRPSPPHRAPRTRSYSICW